MWQLVLIGSTADGIPRAGHSPVAFQIKTALASRLREAMREYNRVPRRVSVHSLSAQRQKSDETLSASQTVVELSSIAEALATKKEGHPGRQETNPLATPRHHRHPGEDVRSKLIKRKISDAIRNRDRETLRIAKSEMDDWQRQWRDEREGKLAGRCRKLAENSPKELYAAAKAELTRTAAGAAVQTESDEVIVQSRIA